MAIKMDLRGQFANNRNKVVIANANMQGSRTDYPVNTVTSFLSKIFFDYENDILKTISK